MSAVLEAALAYAALGWQVIPLHNPQGPARRCSCGQPQCGNVGKHPRTKHGVKDATTDPGRIRDWWRQWPDANVGIATGKVSGIVALDIDPRNGGDVSLEDLTVQSTVQALTGGGGIHFVFRYPPNVERVPSRALEGAPGIDVKADGGYIVAAPSMHASGKAYVWEASSEPGDVELAELPPFVSVERVPFVSTEAPRGPAAESIVGRAFVEAGLWLKSISDGRAIVVCPWEGEHTTGRRGDGSTILFPPTGSAWGHFHCSHSHCAGRTWRDLLDALPREAVERARAAFPKGAGTMDEKPAIRIGTDLARVVDEGVTVIARCPNVYQRGGRLAHVIRDATTGSLIVRDLAIPTLRENLCAAGAWEKHDKRSDAYVPCIPPDNVVHAVRERGEWSGIRPLVGVVEAPTMRPDGTVIQVRGYDARTGFLFEPTIDFPEIPDRPSREDAIVACAELEEIFADFPFARPAHRSAAVAMLLTLIARPAIDGACPMGAVDATTRGTGKGRLVDAIANVAGGRDAPKTPPPEDDEEAGKLISSIVSEGAPIAVLDNVAHAIDLPSLDNALTSTTWKQRALGQNTTIYAPHRTVWFATGNNLEYGGDLARRVLPIRLESLLENPEEREDFRHADLLGWVRAQRGRLVRAALTILRAHAVAGRPLCGCRPLGSFESWSAIVPPALVWLGRANPLDARLDAATHADRTRDGLAALLEAWLAVDPRGQGLTAAQAIRITYPPGYPPSPLPPGAAELREAIEALVPSTGGKPPSSIKLAGVLRRARRRVIGEKRFESRDARAGVVAWFVVDAAASPVTVAAE